MKLRFHFHYDSTISGIIANVWMDDALTHIPTLADWAFYFPEPGAMTCHRKSAGAAFVEVPRDEVPPELLSELQDALRVFTLMVNTYSLGVNNRVV